MMEKRTQRSTSDPVLCPVKCIRSLIERIYRRVPDAGPDTSINATFLATARSQVTGSALRLFMRWTFTLKGGRPSFGFNAVNIGTRSLRSGAAMGLFLVNHPVMDIMMMGRWLSDAFLVYIRPQVLEWTDSMSGDMIKINTLTDASDSRKTTPSEPARTDACSMVQAKKTGDPSSKRRYTHLRGSL